MTSATDPVLLMSIIGSLLIPTSVFLYSTYRSNSKDRLIKQAKIEEHVIEVEKYCNKLESSLTRIHMRADQIEHDQKKLETAVEVRMDRFQDKLEKIYDILVQGLTKGN